MIVETQKSPEEVRVAAERWYARQLATLETCHGRNWPQHRAWIEDFLREELRQRLAALGWRRQR